MIIPAGVYEDPQSTYVRGRRLVRAIKHRRAGEASSSCEAVDGWLALSTRFAEDCARQMLVCVAANGLKRGFSSRGTYLRAPPGAEASQVRSSGRPSVVMSAATAAGLAAGLAGCHGLQPPAQRSDQVRPGSTPPGSACVASGALACAVWPSPDDQASQRPGSSAARSQTLTREGCAGDSPHTRLHPLGPDFCRGRVADRAGGTVAGPGRPCAVSEYGGGACGQATNRPCTGQRWAGDSRIGYPASRGEPRWDGRSSRCPGRRRWPGS